MVPARVGSYELGTLLGAGGFASVYRVGGAERIAIKLAHDHLPATIARFEREALALATVGAPFVPELLEVSTIEDGRPYLVIELVEGDTVAERLARAPGGLTIRDACSIAIQIVDVLAATHANQLAHRDLKPENIILALDGTARLIDFGLARDCRRDALLTRAGTIVGTAEYMAPEHIRGEPVGLAGDVYGFGIVLYELLLGHPPFVGARAAVEHGHLHLRPPSPSLECAMSEALETLVLACLAKEPGRRPSDLGAVRCELVRELTCGTERTLQTGPARAALKMDSARPVVLLHIAGVPQLEVAGLVATGRARIARHRAEDLVLAFLGSEHERPLEAAVEVANDATSRWGCHAVVHIGRALVRRAGGRVSLFGRDIERPETWIPQAPWNGVVVTPRAAAALGIVGAADERGLVAAPALAASEASQMRLVGRDRELASVCDSVTAALRSARPRCHVIIGEQGAGKSALVDAVERVAQEAGHEILEISCARTIGGPDASVRQLLRYVLRLDSGSVPDDPRAVIAAELGDAVARAAGDVVLAALGWDVDREGIAPPGVFRTELRHAVLVGLQRRTAQSPLVIVVDDAHHADELTLEILARACELVGSALAVVITCTPRFPIPAGVHHVTELQMLDEASTVALVRQLLPPGTRASGAVIQRLARWCGGNPGVLAQLVHVLVLERIIRPHDGTRSWFVAADELDGMPASPAGEWLAARELDTLSLELADLARICALLAPDLSLDELEAVQRRLESAGYDRPMVDAGAGLAMLVEHDLLGEDAAGRFSFRREAMQEALRAFIPEPTRIAVHRCAFAHWQTHAEHRASDVVFRLAYHGAGAGFRADARAYYLTLATRAKARHAYAEAERMLTAAIDLCCADEHEMLFAQLEQRGNVRRLLTHYEGARCDFDRARELAEQLGDTTKIVSVLVSEAAVCDFTQQWDAQARLMQAAHDHSRARLPVAVEARYLNWLGVARARQGRTEEAIDLLRDARAMGVALGDHETEVGSGLLLGYLLVVEGQRDEGLGILHATIDCCERVGDWFHLVIGLNNRIILAKLTDSHAQAEMDCRRAIEISHEHGYHQLEIWGLHNLSLTRWWRGSFDGALAAARCAYELSRERFGTKSSHRERLHYAMHLVARGRAAEVEALLDGLRDQELESTPIDSANLAALRLALRGDTSERSWRAVIDRTREVGDDCDVVEVLWLRGRAALHAGDRAVARKSLREAHREAVRCNAPVANVLLVEKRGLAARSVGDGHELAAH